MSTKKNQSLFNLFESFLKERDKFDSIYNQILNNNTPMLGPTGSAKTESGVNEDGSKWYKTTFTSNDGSYTSTSYVSSTNFKNEWYSTPSNKVTTNFELSNLKKALNEAVESQNFEDAVKLRDLIKAQEQNEEKLIELKDRLKHAIETQNFEVAIRLRNSIKDLETK